MSSGSISKASSGNSNGRRKLNKIDLTTTNEGDEEEEVVFSNFDDDYTAGKGEDDGQDYEFEQPELPFQDKIDTIKPVADHQDKLWKQIDILDDVKKMSRDIVSSGTFFSASHAKALEDLKSAQLALLTNMNKAEKLMDETVYHQIWDLNLDVDGLDDEIAVVKEKLFDKEQFTSIGESIDEIKRELENVKKNIKTVDDSGKDMWDNNDFSVIE